MGGRGTPSQRILNENLGIGRANRDDKPLTAFSSGGTSEQLDKDLAFAAGFDRKDRDAESARHWNGKFDSQFRSEEARLAAQSVFGREMTAHQIGMLVGAPDGAQITVYKLSNDSIEVMMEHGFVQDFGRTFKRGADGSIQTENVAFFGNKMKDDDGFLIHPLGGMVRDSDGNKIKEVKGLGGRILAQQASALRALGGKKIVTEAAGSFDMLDQFSGYYVWSRLGFNAKIPESTKNRMLHQLDKAGHSNTPVYRDLKKAKDLNSLFKADAKNNKKGLYKKHGVDKKKNSLAQLWKRHGDNFIGQFDLTERSVSSRILGKWLAENNIRGARFNFKAKKLKIYN